MLKLIFFFFFKLIVAVDHGEVERLDNLYTRALQNNVKNISLLNETEIKKLEPHVQVSISSNNNNNNLKKIKFFVFFFFNYVIKG